MKLHEVPEDFYRQHQNMVSALKVIRTWAAYDLEQRDFRLALDPEQVVKLIDKTLRRGNET